MPVFGLPLKGPIHLSQLLETGVRTKPHELALVSFESKWTWCELDQASRRLAAHYLLFGLRPGDRIASLLPNRGALIVHYLACIKSGFVATPLNYRYQAPEIDHALQVSGAAVILSHSERDEDLAKCKLGGSPMREFSAADWRNVGPPFKLLNLLQAARWPRRRHDRE